MKTLSLSNPISSFSRVEISYFSFICSRLHSWTFPHYIEYSPRKSLNRCTHPKPKSLRLLAAPGISKYFVTKSSAELVVEPNLITMKLETPQFQSIFTPELRCLVDLFLKYNYELRIAGGAVRDLLADKVPDDIDFATTATPTQMKEMFTAEGIRMLNANGEAHGTITARLNEKENFEVTTLRIDKVTDGRRAEVEFTQDWMLDSNRRDLTVNSMFLGFDGTVYDYFSGLEDLKANRVRFVGDPVQRIQEDYLRILRYFRFYGRLAKGPNDHEDVTLDAIRNNAAGLARVSGERIWTELRKILAGKMAGAIVKTMIDLDMGEHIGLPNAHKFDELEAVCMRTEGEHVNPVTRIAACLDNEDDVYLFLKRTKMSNDELSLAVFLINHRGDEMGGDLLAYCTDLHCDSSGKEPKVKAKIVELMKYCGHMEMASEFPNITLPEFPLKGSDLAQTQVPRGPKFAVTLSELRRLWKESRYTLDKEQLLQKVPDVLSNLPERQQDLKNFTAKKIRKK